MNSRQFSALATLLLGLLLVLSADAKKCAAPSRSAAHPHHELASKGAASSSHAAATSSVAPNSSSKVGSAVGSKGSSSSKAASASYGTSEAASVTSHVASQSAASGKAVSKIAASPSASSSSAAPSLSSSATASAKGNWKTLIPNGNKAGVAGGDALPWLNKELGWYYNWNPNPNDTTGANLKRMSMLWGLGTTSDPKDKPRFEQFKQLPVPANAMVGGFNEPDWQGSGSSGYIDPQTAAAAWDKYIAPHGRAGAKLVSPSCAKQKDETWMRPFLDAVQYKPDILSVHIFVNNTQLLQEVLEHYAQYDMPMLITEFACIDYQGQHKYCDQGMTNDLVKAAVKVFENDDRVIGYALSDAYNGPDSYLTNGYTGARLKSLTVTGSVYLNAVSSAKSAKRALTRAAQGMRRHVQAVHRQQRDA